MVPQFSTSEFILQYTMESDAQSGSQTNNSMIAVFSNVLIFPQILKYLDINDIKNCCQVCSLWNVAAYPRFLVLKTIRTMISYKNGHKYYNSAAIDKRYTIEQINASPEGHNLIISVHKELLDDEDMVYIVQLTNHFGCNITYFQYSVRVNILDEVKLFQKILPSFQKLKTLDLKLHISMDDSDFNFPSNGFIPLEFKALKTVQSLIFSTGWTFNLEISKNNAINYATVATDLHRIFPNIRSLTLTNPNKFGCDNPIFEFFFNTLLSDDVKMDFIGGSVEFKRNWILNKLKIEEPALKLPEYNFLTGSKVITNLSSLSTVIYFDPKDGEDIVDFAKAYEALLWKHAHTLTSLTLHNLLCRDKGNNYWSTCDVCLPVMPKLTALEVVLNKNEPCDYPSVFQFNFKFQGQGHTSGQGQPISEGTETFVYSNQFPVLRNFSVRVYYSEKKKSLKKARFEQMKIVLQNFVVNAECEESQIAKSTTLRHFDLFGIDDIDLKEFGINFVQAFPNVYSPTFNRLRELST